MAKFLRECPSHASEWLTQYGLIDIECIHLLNHCLDKRGIPNQYNGIPRIGFITSNTASLFDLFKGSHIIVYWNNSSSVYLSMYNVYHTLIWRAIIWYNEITLKVLISRYKLTPTHEQVELFYDQMEPIRKCLSHMAKCLLHTIQYFLNDIEWFHSLRHCLCKMDPPTPVPHPTPPPVIQYLWLDSLYSIQYVCYNIMTWLIESRCHMGVIIWYDVISPGVSKWPPHTMQYSLINIECLVWSQTSHDVINLSGWVHRNIFYRCDRTAWCVGHILHHEISISGAISWYYKITPLSHLEEI